MVKKANLFWNGMRAGARNSLSVSKLFLIKGMYILHLLCNYVCTVNHLLCSAHFRRATGHLFAIGSKPKGVETQAGSIDLTDELRAMDGAIIECRSNVDRRWNFVRVRNDCENPNVHIWLSGT